MIRRCYNCEHLTEIRGGILCCSIDKKIKYIPSDYLKCNKFESRKEIFGSKKESFNTILRRALKESDVEIAKRYINDDYEGVDDDISYVRENDKKILMNILEEYLEDETK